MPTKVHPIKAMVFPVVMYRCESWTIKKVEQWGTDAFELLLEKTLESPLDCKKIQPVHPKGNHPWMFIGRTDVEAETPILWPPDVKYWLSWKDTDSGKDWRQEEKGITEVEIVGWHHWLSGHEFEQSSGVGDGQGSLVCCSPRGHKELDTTEWPNWTEGQWCPLLKWGLILYIFVGLPLSWLETVLGFHLVFELFPGAYQVDSFMPCLLQATMKQATMWLWAVCPGLRAW